MSHTAISHHFSAGEIHTITVGTHHRIPMHEFERFRDALMGDTVQATTDELEADLTSD